jgi:ABC-type dipeptide/oligopeptide/nickel transport system ATPase component
MSNQKIYTIEQIKRFLRTSNASKVAMECDVSIDSFFNIHSAVLGNSGGGKSNAIAHIIQEIHKKESRSESKIDTTSHIIISSTALVVLR